MSPYAHVGQCIVVGGLAIAVVWLLVALIRSDLRENPAPEVYDDAELDDEDDGEGDWPEPDDPDLGDAWDRAYDRWLDEQSGVA